MRREPMEILVDMLSVCRTANGIKFTHILRKVRSNSPTVKRIIGIAIQKGLMEEVIVPKDKHLGGVPGNNFRTTFSGVQIVNQYLEIKDRCGM